MSDKKNIKKELKEQYEKACTAYRDELLRMWELDEYYADWIADEIGGTLDYGCGMFTLNMDEIIYCVDNDVTEAEVMEWQEYICDASEFGFDIPNLRSWHKGRPRIPASAFERLREMKRALEDAVEEEKKGLKF